MIRFAELVLLTSILALGFALMMGEVNKAHKRMLDDAGDAYLFEDIPLTYP